MSVSSNLTNFVTRRVRKPRTKFKFYERWHILKTSCPRISAVKMVNNLAGKLLELMVASNANKPTLRMTHGSALHLNRNRRRYLAKVSYGRQVKSIEVNLVSSAHP